MRTVRIVGPTQINKANLGKWLSRFESLGNFRIEENNRQVPLTDQIWLSDHDAEKLFVEPSDVLIVSVPIQNNWFCRPIGPKRSALVTTYEIDEPIIEFWPLEKRIAYIILHCIQVQKYLSRGGKHEELYTRNVERSVFNFSADKKQARIGIDCLQIGDRARNVLRSVNFTEAELSEFQKDLDRMKVSPIDKAMDSFWKSNWIQLFVGFILGIIVNYASGILGV